MPPPPSFSRMRECETTSPPTGLLRAGVKSYGWLSGKSTAWRGPFNFPLGFARGFGKQGRLSAFAPDDKSGGERASSLWVKLQRPKPAPKGVFITRQLRYA